MYARFLKDALAMHPKDRSITPRHRIYPKIINAIYVYIYIERERERERERESQMLVYPYVCNLLEGVLAIHPKGSTMMPRHRIYPNVVVSVNLPD